MLDGNDPEGQTFFPLQDRINGGSSTATAMSGSATAISDSNNGGYATQTATSSSGGGAMEEIIPTTFDEATLRTLCDMDVSRSYPT